MFPGSLQHCWSSELLAANVVIGLHLVGALLVGMGVGYERSYHGRAAGMRTYGLVCMASTALTVFVGFAPLWYGGSGNVEVAANPASVVQGVVTGAGFLCAGVIMKDGLSIRGLTTAASIWAVSAIGVLLGVGFYLAGLVLALLCTCCMSLLQRLESRLPGRSVLDVTLEFRAGFLPCFDEVSARAEARGYSVMRESLTITSTAGQPVWRFSALAMDRSIAVSPALLADKLAASEGVANFSIVPVRN